MEKGITRLTLMKKCGGNDIAIKTEFTARKLLAIRKQQNILTMQNPDDAEGDTMFQMYTTNNAAST